MAKHMVQMEDKVFIENLNRALLGRENENSMVNSISEGFELFLNSILPSQHSYESPPTVKGVMNRAAFPLGFGHSSRYVGSRTVLVGDAAHRIHPLAGQGVNLGFGDVACLAEVVEGMVMEGGGLGHHEYLCQYESERQRHNLATMVGVDALQKLYCTDSIPLVLARSLGLTATNAAGPVKNLIRQHAG
jgi:ubiquinone biosynthesis monooxygenase Coq6